MGFGIPQVITETKASGAQVIDGGLKFDSRKGQRLTRTPSTAGNRKTWTWSAWVKNVPSAFSASNHRNLFSVDGGGADATRMHMFIGNASNKLQHDLHSQSPRVSSSVYRDVGWYHVLIKFDSTQSTARNQISWYINGQQIVNWDTENSITQDNDYGVNGTYLHAIGSNLSAGPGQFFDGLMSKVYLIDGAALEPENFGFTDPLTGTWRPKKFDIRAQLAKNPNDGTTWSNSLTTNAGDNFDGNGAKTKAFDGNGSNKAFTANNSDGTTQGTSYLEMVFPTAISGALRVKCDNGNTVRNTTGGGDVLLATQNTGSDNQFVDCGTVSGLTNLRVLMSGGSRPAISMIELDGYVFLDGKQNNSFYLPMDGNSPVGEDKSGVTTINDGTMWSSYVTASNTMYNYDGAAMFLGDGNTGFDGKLNTRIDDWNGVYNTNHSYQLEFVPPTPIPYKHKVEVYTVAAPQSPYNNDFYIDTGSGYGSAIDHVQNSWVTLATGTGSVTKIKSTASQNGTSWTAIKIDGVILVNNVKGNDFTPTNFGGSVTVDNPQATGALPILNTTQGGSQAGVGVRTDSNWSSLVLALPLVGGNGDVSNLINGGSTTKTFTTTGAVVSTTKSNFYGASLSFDGSDDRLVSATSSDFTFGTGSFTVEGWVYPETNNANKTIFSTNWGANGSFIITYSHPQSASAAGRFAIFDHSQNNGQPTLATIHQYPVNNWYHVAFVRNGNSHKFYINGIEAASNTYTASNLTRDVFVLGAVYTSGGETFDGFIQDVRVYKGAAKYTSNFVVPSRSPDILPDTPSGVSGGSKLTKITDGAVSFDATGDYLSMADSSDFAFGTGDFTVECFIYPKGNTNYRAIIDCRDQVSDPGGWILGVNTNDQLYIYTDGFLLTSADTNTVTAENKWYHVAYVRNSGTHKIYIDGKEADSSSTSIDYDTDNCVIGASYAKNSEYWNGLISNVRLVKGTALYTSDFTPPTRELTNVTNTKLLCCQSPTSATTAAVAPGSITANGDAAATNFNPFNTDINTVRGQETGYATLNPLNLHNTADTISDGNLKLTSSGSGSGHFSLSTLSMSSGKYFCEVEWLSVNHNFCGIKGINDKSYNNSYVYLSNAKASDTNGSSEDASYGSSWTTGDTIGIAYDADGKTLEFFKNGVSQGIAFTNITGTYEPYPTSYGFFFGNWSGQDATYVANFGQKPFKFPPPDGFQPLNAANVRPETVITRPDQYFAVTTYTGENNTRSIEIGMKPDLVWFKSRNNNYDNELYDSVRGATNRIYSNATDEESSFANGLTSFDSKGFSIGDRTNLNGSSSTMVAWAWKAGGNKGVFNVDDVGYASAAAAGLSGGDRALTGCSVNTKAGFSIISWVNGTTTNPSNARVRHGLNQVPDLVIYKDRDSGSSQWAVKMETFSNPVRDELYLETTQAKTTAGVDLYFRDSDYIGHRETSIGGDEGKIIAYCWHNVPGLQKFGSYTGQGSKYPFVELGFRPAVVWIKNITTGGTHYDWSVNDIKRNPFNLGADNANSKDTLFLNLSDSENKGGSAWQQIDFLSNGFRVNDSSVSVNADNSNYIYCAWAEAPSFNLYGGSSNGL